jgi:hypothetical protein
LKPDVNLNSGVLVEIALGTAVAILLAQQRLDRPKRPGDKWARD